MIKNKNHTKKIILVLLGVALASALAYGVYTQYYKGDADNTNTSAEEAINFDPPTEEEKAEADAHKDEVVRRQEIESNSQENSSGPKKNADVTLSSWPSTVGKNQNVEVNGFVSNVYENGGTCTLTLKKSGQTAKKNQTARKDAQTTTCGLISMPRASVSPGTWKATITYSSKTASGVSQTVNIKVE
jgi:hypothetical protein